MPHFTAKNALPWMAVLVSSAALLCAQTAAPVPGAAPAGPARALPWQNRPLPNTALGQEAALLGSLAPRIAQMPDFPGYGPFPASYAMAPNGMEDVVYQPRDLAAAEAKGKLGVYVWGNGGCSPDAASSRFHLAEIASHGYVVIAPGKILSGPEAPPRAADGNAGPGMPRPGSGATAEKMIAGLDWILAENQRQGSPYFGAIDTHRVAVAGFSCGGLIALKAGFDPRVTAVLIESSGILTSLPPGAMGMIPQMAELKKSDLAKLHTPVIYILGGPQDIAEGNGLDDFEHINSVPIFVADEPGEGHGGPIALPNGPGTEIEVQWLDWQFDHDPLAARMFVGPDCVLCRDDRFQVHRKGIE